MNIIKKLIIFIKNIFTKQDEVKKLEEPKETVNNEKKEEFFEYIKISNNKKAEYNEDVETLICAGDGLGIQKRLKST